MANEQIDGLKINPSKLKEQCATIAQNYDYENASYVLLADRISLLCEQEDLSGSAIAGLKTHMSNYKIVLEALCYANELDKCDINTLNSILDSELGSDVLDGTEILANISQAETDYEKYSWKRNDWYSEYMDAEWYDIIYIDLCNYTYKYYEKLMDDALEDKEYWTSRGELLINISTKLSGLFINGNILRDYAKEGLNNISAAFDTNTNTYLISNTLWKEKLDEYIYGSIKTDTGEINWSLIEQILSKDADAISDTEYMLAATAYMNADIEELNDFFVFCRIPEHIDQTTWGLLFAADKMDSQTFGDKRMMTLDSEKINAICRQANIYQTNLLALIRYGDLDEEVRDDKIAERDNILQRITMAYTLDDIHTFYGDRDNNNFFDFVFSDEGLGPDESLTVNYYSFMCMTDSACAALAPHSITVTNTMTGTGISGYSSEVFMNLELDKLTSYSTAIVGNNLGHEALNIVLEKINVNGIAIFGMELVEEICENEKKQAFICDLYDKEDITTVCNYFDCYGNFILYDKNVEICIYEGEYTDQRVEEIGVLLGNDNLNTKYLLEYPKAVFDECINYMEIYGDKKFHNIVNGAE